MSSTPPTDKHPYSRVVKYFPLPKERKEWIEKTWADPELRAVEKHGATLFALIFSVIVQTSAFIAAIVLILANTYRPNSAPAVHVESDKRIIKISDWPYYNSLAEASQRFGEIDNAPPGSSFDFPTRVVIGTIATDKLKVKTVRLICTVLGGDNKPVTSRQLYGQRNGQIVVLPLQASPQPFHIWLPIPDIAGSFTIAVKLYIYGSGKLGYVLVDQAQVGPFLVAEPPAQAPVAQAPAMKIIAAAPSSTRVVTAPSSTYVVAVLSPTTGATAQSPTTAATTTPSTVVSKTDTETVLKGNTTKFFNGLLSISLTDTTLNFSSGTYKASAAIWAVGHSQNKTITGWGNGAIVTYQGAKDEGEFYILINSVGSDSASFQVTDRTTTQLLNKAKNILNDTYTETVLKGNTTKFFNGLLSISLTDTTLNFSSGTYKASATISTTGDPSSTSISNHGVGYGTVFSSAVSKQSYIIHIVAAASDSAQFQVTRVK